MPNYCGNKMVITGPVSDRERLVSALQKVSNLEFIGPKIIPLKSKNKNALAHNEDKTTYLYLTKWEPIEEQLITAWTRKHFSTLKFKIYYVEKGNNFYGYCKIYGEERKTYYNNNIDKDLTNTKYKEPYEISG